MRGLRSTRRSRRRFVLQVASLSALVLFIPFVAISPASADPKGDGGESGRSELKKPTLEYDPGGGAPSRLEHTPRTETGSEGSVR
jgi:hypothetical protein